MGKLRKRLIRSELRAALKKGDLRRADCLLGELCPQKPVHKLRGSDWNSPLRQAIIDDDAEKLRSLLASGEEPNEIDLKWRTELDFALMLKKEKCILALREHGGKTFDELWKERSLGLN